MSDFPREPNDAEAQTPPIARKGRPPGERRLELLQDFLGSFDLKSKLGVEIGPYDRPILPKPDYDMIYADVFSTEELRRMGAANKNRDASKVVDVEIVLRDQTLGAAIEGRNVKYVFGSHVYEHIPNLLGFLREVAESLGPGGLIIGAFPDRRYTYDIERPRTTLGQLLDRDARNVTKPDPDIVFDHRFYFRPVKSPAIWALGEAGIPERQFTFDHAMAKMELSHEDYVDAHCNLFSDEEFAEAMAALGAAGRLPLSVASVTPTVRPFNEFFFALKVVDGKD